MRIFKGLAASCCVCLVGFTVVANEGFTRRLSKKSQVYASYESFKDYGKVNGCSIRPENTKPPCLSYDNGSQKVLIIGDSLTRNLAPSLARHFPSWYITSVSSHGCRPLLKPVGPNLECHELMKSAFAEIVPKYEFDSIILAALWRDTDEEQMTKLLEYLRPYTKKIYILGRTIAFQTSLPSYLAGKESLLKRRSRIEYSSNYDNISRVDKRFSERFQSENVKFFSMVDIICPNKNCKTLTPEGVPMQRDNLHFTKEGANYVIKNLKYRGLLN